MDEQMSMTKEYKKAKVMAIVSCILILLAFSCLIMTALTQYYDDFSTVFLPVTLTGFFGGNIIALIMLCKAYPVLLASDCVKMEERYEKQEPQQISLPGRDSCTNILLANKFEYTREGYYRRKRLSLLKDSVCYYVRMTEDTEVEKAMRREVEYLYQTGKKDKNLCMLLFVYMDEVGEHEQKEIKELGKRNIVMESVINPNISLTILAIAVDRGTNTGYYMGIGRHGMFTLYAYGCKMLKKLFAPEADSQPHLTP